jgi:hypothetical protein
MMSQNEGGRSVAMEDDEPAGVASRGTRRVLDEARLRQQAIGVKLRQLFDQVVNEPVPTDFLEILRRGDEKARTADD